MVVIAASTVAGLGYAGSIVWPMGGDASQRPVTSTVRRGSLEVLVTERGNLESTKTVDGLCEVEQGQVKIIFLVPEGSVVQKDEVVCRFDDSELQQRIAQQKIKVEQTESKIETSRQELEIQQTEGQSAISAAEVELALAKLDKTKYEEGDFGAEMEDLRGMIAKNKRLLDEAREKLVQFRELERKGFRSRQQVEQVEIEIEEYQSNLTRDELKLNVKQKYEYERQMVELTSNIEQAESKLQTAKANNIAKVAKARSELKAAQATYEIERTELDKMLMQLEKCTIKAEQGGVVAYANEPWYDSSRQIREGATVYYRQTIFSLPDMSSMQVKVNVHESQVKKVSTGQRAEIRVDAIPNHVLTGTVKSVSQLADSNRSWMSGGAKAYTTVVLIDELPEPVYKPGMTAEVRIEVATIEEALLAPVQTIASHRGDHYAFGERSPGRFEPIPVQIGMSNDRYVEVLDGLEIGQVVAHDARLRARDYFDDDLEDQEDEPEVTPEPNSNAVAARSVPIGS